MLVSQSVWAVLRQSVTFLDFWLSQGSVATTATCCRLDGNLCDVYIENFLTNHLVKEFWKLVHICQSYYQTIRGLAFWNAVYNLSVNRCINCISYITILLFVFHITHLCSHTFRGCSVAIPHVHVLQRIFNILLPESKLFSKIWSR